MKRVRTKRRIEKARALKESKLAYGRWLGEWLEKRSMTQEALADAMTEMGWNMHRTAPGKLIKGMAWKTEYIVPLTEILRAPLPEGYLPARRYLAKRTQPLTIPIEREIEAGVFKKPFPASSVGETDYFTDREFPNSPRVAYKFKGDSMSDARIYDGDILCCIPITEDVVITHGERVVVKKTNADGFVEWSARVVYEMPDRIEYAVSCPDKSRYDSHVIMRRSGKRSSENGTIEVVAIIRRSVRDFRPAQP